MFERFTRAARGVVTDAREKAEAATASEVRAEHLLAALLGDERSTAVTVLEDVGVDLEGLRERLDHARMRYVDGLDEDDAAALRVLGIDLDDVVRRIDRNLGGAGDQCTDTLGRRLRFSREAKKVLELSLREAIALGHDYIGTEHILLGLARCSDRVVSETLTTAGVRRAPLRDAVRNAVRRAG
ncbi:MAG TPA: Clp protease N-terminal domain-containing protein [Nocardioidaceae bacterium]|nr:Clp protease N-terminal domain-containing protein [Nocardioidaceae bacterium]